ncbi:hypothetical protein CBER1_07277 [Cercospora berteroae]|uniref:Uncharacterized protein n=1 Tax=Cercospora berteroae TaxID=357750 RepID=A0A2S6BTM1_9PEZI|nr:hypothetical protein CBER1_07277 [Cercospora berteroae]
MLTADPGGQYRSDNHAWLYGWKNGSVFQAGSSIRQNWYGTSNSGSVQQAGSRPNTDHQMCGTSVMYNTGKILSCGGSRNYDGAESTRATHVTTITNAFQSASNERVADMSWPRVYHNSVVLPDGKVLKLLVMRTLNSNFSRTTESLWRYSLHKVFANQTLSNNIKEPECVESQRINTPPGSSTQLCISPLIEAVSPLTIPMFSKCLSKVTFGRALVRRSAGFSLPETYSMLICP